MARDKRAATTAAQTELVAGGKELRIDGAWGQRSQNAFDTATPGLKVKTEQAAQIYGYSIKDFGYSATWMSKSALDPLVNSASAATGRSSKMLWDFIHLEARSTFIDGESHYNVTSVAPSGLFHGLTQMGLPAWSDVQAMFPATPSFLSGRYDAAANILAGARYSMINERYLRSKGYKGPFTVEVMYSAHNQGAAGFMRLLRSKTENANFKNQSGPAKKVIRLALLQNGVTMA